MDTSDFVIELPQIEFNPNDFLSFIDNYEFENYVSSYGNKTPQEFLQISLLPSGYKMR